MRHKGPPLGSGGPLTHGTSATVTATVWAYSAYSNDALDLYYAANANSPSWVFIRTIVPTKAGAQNSSATSSLFPLAAFRLCARNSASWEERPRVLVAPITITTT